MIEEAAAFAAKAHAGVFRKGTAIPYITHPMETALIVSGFTRDEELIAAALLHDVVIVYFTFVIFQMPINDNFIAVVLTILGYSLNNTIIIYDRIRENRKALGPKAPTSQLVNLSINQTLTRSIFTSLCTFAAIACVCVVGFIYNLTSVTTFALPMMVGVLVGCYSSVCITGPLYVMWRNYKDKTSVKAK